MAAEFERNILAERDRKHSPKEREAQEKENVPKIQYYNADLHRAISGSESSWYWMPMCPFAANKIVVKDAHYRCGAGTATEFYVVIDAISSNAFAQLSHNSDKVVDRSFHVNPAITAYKVFTVKTQYPIGTDVNVLAGNLDISVEFSSPC